MTNTFFAPPKRIDQSGYCIMRCNMGKCVSVIGIETMRKKNRNIGAGNACKFLASSIMSRKLLIGFLSLAFFSIGPVQQEIKAQDPEFTQFYANPLYLNPAFAGTEKCPRVALNYRNQWPALTGTYVTYSASYDQHVDALSGGLGLLVTNDQQAQTLFTTRIAGMYSYELQVTRKFSIRAGFEATYFQRSLDWSKLTFGDMIDPRKGFIYQTNDTPRGGSVSNVDFSGGILGYSEKYFFGVAAHHLNTPNESLISGNSPLPMKLTGHAGANIALRSSRFTEESATLSPNVLYRHQGNFQQLNLGLYIKKGPIVGGLWYRNRDAFIALLGFETDMIRFGYSYDVTISDLTPSTAGAHEASFTIFFDCKPKRRKFRTISCPSF